MRGRETLRARLHILCARSVTANKESLWPRVDYPGTACGESRCGPHFGGEVEQKGLVR